MSSKGKAGWQEFLKVCAEINSPSDLNDFFDLFLTIDEKETVASRYLIVKALLKKSSPNVKSPRVARSVSHRLLEAPTR